MSPDCKITPLKRQIGDVVAKAGRGGCLRLATGQLLGAVVLADDQACGQDQKWSATEPARASRIMSTGLAGDHVERLADGGERRVQVLCRVHVVEADDRQVSGQGQAACWRQRYVERRDVVACEDRSRPFGGGQVEQLACALIAAFRHVVAVGDQLGIQLDPGATQRGGVATVAGLSGFCVGWSVDDADALMAEFDEGAQGISPSVQLSMPTPSVS